MCIKRLFSSRFDPVFLLILVAASFLFFYRLDQRPFWQDEAETACLARNVLQHGVPVAFDGVNLISQEERREFEADYLWRWSPWMQIYVAAAAFKVGGLTTWAGRFPFALAGLACIWLVYLLIRRSFDDLNWARMSAALLALSVPFLLYSRQCRYYSLGALLVLLCLHGFQGRWRSKLGPAALLTVSLGLLFHANYLLFLSFAAGMGIAALVFYRQEIWTARSLKLIIAVGIMTVPWLLLFRAKQQSGMLNFTTVPDYLVQYLADLLQFILPLPIAAVLLWRWRRFRGEHGRLPDDGERFVLFLFLILLANTAIMAFIPQREHRYLLHLYPLGAIALGWAVCRAWRYQRFSGVLLALLLGLTNWLHLVPMELLKIDNTIWHNTPYMLTLPNLPLKLYLTELRSGYPDVNQSLIRFFQTHARPGDTVLTTYGDLPLQFYTRCRVLGGLQGAMPELEQLPDWVVKRRHTRMNREQLLNTSEDFILNHLNLPEDYETVVLPYPDDRFGNRADPYYHEFVPATEPFAGLTVHRKKQKADHDPHS